MYIVAHKELCCCCNRQINLQSDILGTSFAIADGGQKTHNECNKSTLT